MSEVKELKPCPFCGPNKSEVGIDFTFVGKHQETKFFVGCGRCGSQSGLCKSKEDAIEIWNKRPSTGEASGSDELIKKFDEFVKKWCGSHAPHLLDSDENDGEKFRQLLESASEAFNIGAIKPELEDLGFDSDDVNDICEVLKRFSRPRIDREKIQNVVSSIPTNTVNRDWHIATAIQDAYERGGLTDHNK